MGTRWIPTGVKRALRWGLALPGRLVAKPLSRRGWTASVYYALFSGHFSREHRAVLLGKARFAELLRHPEAHGAYLRRGIHRLEKGLAMRPRRPVFGEAFIEPLTAYYGEAVAQGVLDPAEGRWARDVLRAYFEAVAPTPTITRARTQFEAAAAAAVPAFPRSEPPAIPYASAARPGASVSFEALQALAQRRRAVRWYDGRPVPEALLRQAIDLAALAPSACNRQPFWVYSSADAEAAVAMARCAGGTEGWAENIPCTLALVGDLGNYSRERDRHLIYIDSALFAMQLMLALETLGLATCPINWPDTPVAETRLAKLLGLTPELRPVMLVSVGYALEDGLVPYSQKKGAGVLMRRVSV